MLSTRPNYENQRKKAISEIQRPPVGRAWAHTKIVYAKDGLPRRLVELADMEGKRWKDRPLGS
jgi:hypothetical protein